MKKIEKEKKLLKYDWIIKITILAFVISFVFSILSESIIPNVNIWIAIVLLFIFIAIGILFDMIGVAVTSSDEVPLHSMNARKVKGAKMAVNLKKNADRVSSFCNDVIGDICGIVSGTVGVAIASSLSQLLTCPIFITSLIVTALIASLTIGGKAMFKGIAIHKSNQILFGFAKFLSIFKRK